MKVEHLDHLVLTVADIGRTVRFYESVLGMEEQMFAGGRIALGFGTQKINLHEAGREFEPKSAAPTPGSADLCFVTGDALEEVLADVRRAGVDIIEGPVERAGATGPIRSFYFRDPDGNLIEIAQYCPVP